MITDPFIFVIIAACLAVGAVLVWGVTLFGTGGDAKKSNKVMQLRIAAQFVAVVLIVGFAYFRSQGAN